MQQDNDKPNDQQGTQAAASGMEWMNEQRPVWTQWEKAEHEAAWWDATLDATGVFGMEAVTPIKAALVLCRLNPRHDTKEVAEVTNTDETTPDDFKCLLDTFEDRALARPRNRSLLDWMAVAAGAGRKTHSWAARYAKHHGLYGPPAPEPQQEKLHGNIVLVNVTAQANHYQQHNVHHHHPAPAPEEAPPAPAAPEPAPAPPPVSAPVSEPEQQTAPAKIDFKQLATRDQLIDAFGRFVGMDARWFDKVGDTPALARARKVQGQGGKGQIAEPFFCPFEVMLWLIDPKRRKGRKLGEAKGWELLEKNFPNVYNAHSTADPRPN